MSKISELEDKNYAQFKEIQSLIEERDKRIDKWAEIVQKLEAEVQEFRDADTEGNGLLRIAYRTLKAENDKFKQLHISKSFQIAELKKKLDARE